MKVGFIGLGRMGMPMARQLLRAGFPLTVYNRTASRALLLGDGGAAVVESPAEVAARSDVVITMLADGDAVASVLLASDGVLSRATGETVLVDMSTIGPDAARRLAAQAAEQGARMLDAPVSGSVSAAESATLTTVVGGERAAFERVRPVLAAMTARQLWLGANGAGATMKLALNGLIAATNQAVAEALVVAEAWGIESGAAYEAIATSAVGSRFVDYKRDAFLHPGDSPVAFTLALLDKDLALYQQLGDAVGVPLVSAAAVTQALGAARASQGDGADIAAVADDLRRSITNGHRSGKRVVKGLHHVGITVADLEKAIDFYHGVVGLPFVNEPSPVFDDPQLGPAVGVPGAALRQVSLALGDTILELLEYAAPPSPVDAPLPQNALGAQHVAFLVEDAAVTKAELEGRGVRFFSDVNVVDEGVLAGWRWVYFADPEGNALELVQIAYTRPEERRAAIAAYLEQRATREEAVS